MLTKQGFEDILERRGTLIIDGALATELEARGHDLRDPLWSGKVLQNDPASIMQVHLDYYLAGADIAITCSYQTSFRGIQEQMHISDASAAALVQRSAQLAIDARTELYAQGCSRLLLVAGSVGPYGAYLADGSEYRGDYVVSNTELKDFHRQRIGALIEAGVDILFLETMPNLGEIESLLELLQEFPDSVAALSCTLKDAGHISDGSSIAKVLGVVHRSSQIIAFGANCVPPELITQFLSSARTLTSLPLLCYPNSGESYDGESKTWSGSATKSELASRTIEDWVPAGARLIGGCCRTTPRHIEALTTVLQAQRTSTKAS